jgi:tetratricopeptide (TPR) repeat protein
MGFFFLLSLLCWVRFVEIEAKDRWKFYLAALVAYALALFSKTTACTLPAALFLVLWLKRKPINLQRIVQITPFIVLGLAMGLVSIWWEKYHQGTQGELFSIGPLDRIMVASHAVWFYLAKLVWPAQLSFSYPRWPISTANPFDYLWLLLIVATIIAVWFGRRYFGRGVEVALLYFVATPSPVLGFIMLYTFRYSWVADHYQYLASIGPLALAAAAISVGFDRFEKLKTPLFALACSVLLIALGMRTWKQGAIYANQETLWRATIATNPKSWMAYNNLAIEALKAGRIEEALAGYRKAIELDPSYTEAHYNLGNALLRVDRTEEAIASYQNALSLYPKFAAAQANLGAAQLKAGRAEEAINHLREAIKIDPRMANAEQSLGNALLSAGQGTEAIVHLGKALEMDPTLPRIEHDLATAFAQSGGREQAADHWKKALEADPDDVAAHNAIAMRLAENGRVEESLPHFRKVAQLEPESATAHYNLATSLSRTGRLEEAIAHYREALRLKPDYAAAHVNLANTFGQTGRLEEAVGEFYLALDLYPDSAAAQRNLGLTLHMLGRDDEAEPHMQRAAELEAAAPKP